MKYMFVIQGEGRGHLTQAITLKKMLENNGHEVVAVMTGISKNRKLPTYFYSKINTEVLQFLSPNFLPSPKNKKPFLLVSIVYNLLLLPVYIESILNIRMQIKISKPDVVVNFYELLCGLTYGIFQPKPPMVNIAHQYYLLSPHFKYQGKKQIQFKLLNIFSRLTLLNSSKVLALSFRRETSPPAGKIHIVPPLLRHEVLNASPKTGDYILGYLLNDGYYNELVQWSKTNNNEKLHFFWDKKNVQTTMQVNNRLSLHTLDDAKFIQFMAGAKAYATTAGFESVCEAMFLQKPVLMVPTHIEQECNALDAIKSGAGISDDNFNLNKLLNFIPAYHQNPHFRRWVLDAEEYFVCELTHIDPLTENLFMPLNL